MHASGPGRRTRCRCTSPTLAARSHAEFLAVDTETNGLARERCELTEVGAVLVGGGELHDRWSSLVGVARPLSRGIQRFTGITQAMVDAAPPPEAVLPELARLLRGRVLVAHNARFDPACCAGVRARGAGLAGAAGAVHGRAGAPLRAAAAPARARHAGRGARHRGRGEPTARCPTRRRARACSARCSRGCARTRRRSATRVALLGRARTARRPRPARQRRAGDAGPTSARCRGPGRLRVPRRRRPPAVRRQVGLRAHARARALHAPAAWTAQAEHVDCQATESELGALLLENRLIRALKPPGNKRGKRSPTATSTCAAGSTSRSRSSRSRASRRPATRSASGRCAGSAAAAELVEQLNSLFGLRHCGRKLPRRDHPSRLRADGPLPVAVPRRPRPEPLPRAARRGAARCSSTGATAAPRCSPTSTRRCARRRRSSDYERAAWLRRRRERLETLLGRLGGVLRAIHAGARLVLAPHPAERRARSTRSGSSAAGSSTGARCPPTPTSSRRARGGAARRAAAGARRLAAGRGARRGAARRRLAGRARPRACSSSTRRRRDRGRSPPRSQRQLYRAATTRPPRQRAQRLPLVARRGADPRLSGSRAAARSTCGLTGTSPTSGRRGAGSP